MSSALSGNFPLSSRAGSPSPIAPMEEDIILEDDDVSLPALVSTTTERPNEMDLAADLHTNLDGTSFPAPTLSTEGEETVNPDTSPQPAPPVTKLQTLTEVLKKVLLKKENAQIAYLKALNNSNVNIDEANILRENVNNLDKHVKTLSDVLNKAAAAANPSSTGLKISKRNLPKLQLEDKKTKPFPHEEAYRSVDHFLSELEETVYSSGQDIETVWRNKKFGAVVSRIHKRRAVMNMEIGFRESVDEYSNRFFRTVGEAGYHLDDEILVIDTKRQSWIAAEIHNAAIDLFGEKTPQYLLLGKDTKHKFDSTGNLIAATISLSTTLLFISERAKMLSDRNLLTRRLLPIAPTVDIIVVFPRSTAKRQKSAGNEISIFFLSAASDTEEEIKTDMMTLAVKKFIKTKFAN